MTARQRTAGASAPALPRNRWVVCDAYEVGPITQTTAERIVCETEQLGACLAEHRIEVR